MFTLPKEENWKYQGSGGMLKTNLFKGKYVNWNLQRGRGLTPPPKKNLLGVTMNIFPGTIYNKYTFLNILCKKVQNHTKMDTEVEKCSLGKIFP